MSETHGLIMINTGDGKGKSTAAFGLALRALGRDMKVCIIQFMKGDTDTGERYALQRFLPMVRLESTGTDTFVDRDNPSPADLSEADRGMNLAQEVLGEEYDLVILDEINVAISFGLVSLESVLRLLAQKPTAMHLLLTGRDAPQRLREAADMVSVIQDEKHHFYKGIPAQPGIEY